MVSTEEIKTLYASGLSQNKIAKQLNCSRSLVQQRLQQAGVTMRSISQAKRYPISPEVISQVGLAYDAGMQLVDIGRLFNLTEKLVQRCIRNKPKRPKPNFGLTDLSPRAARAKHNLAQAQRDLILGTLLGDASLCEDNNSFTFSTVHCQAQRGYIEYIREVMGHGSMSDVVQTQGYAPGNTYTHYKYRNKGALLDIWDIVMVSGKKTVNDNWIRHLTKESLAYWFMDDGSSVWVGRGLNKRSQVRVSFATYSFNEEELRLLLKHLLSLGLKASLAPHEEKRTLSTEPQFGIVLSQTCSEQFMGMVAPILSRIPCMRYKLKYPTP